MKPICLILNTLLLTLILSSSAQATLISRLGGDAIYDTESNLTWMANANLAATNTFGVTGINTNGTMDWNTANLWTGAMNTANHLGFNDWRLPILEPINGTAFNLTFTGDGSTDIARNISRPGTVYGTSLASEMAYLFYNSLGNVSDFNVSGVADNGCAGTCLNNTDIFVDFQSSIYWLGTEQNPSRAFLFDTPSGIQGTGPKSGVFFFAAAVRSGDVAPVPVPAAIWMMGSALLGLIGFQRKK